jgi:hypothetical protein
MHPAQRSEGRHYCTFAFTSIWDKLTAHRCTSCRPSSKAHNLIWTFASLLKLLENCKSWLHVARCTKALPVAQTSKMHRKKEWHRTSNCLLSQRHFLLSHSLSLSFRNFGRHFLILGRVKNGPNLAHGAVRDQIGHKIVVWHLLDEVSDLDTTGRHRGTERLWTRQKDQKELRSGSWVAEQSKRGCGQTVNNQAFHIITSFCNHMIYNEFIMIYNDNNIMILYNDIL